MTHQLLEKMRSDCQLIAIETNKYFVSLLKKRFIDPRLKVVNDTAENVVPICKKLNFQDADYIISGIPLSFLAPEDKINIINNSASALRNEGKMIIYQSLTTIGSKKLLRKLFKNKFVTTKNRNYILNFPPLYIFEATAQKNQIDEDGTPSAITDFLFNKCGYASF